MEFIQTDQAPAAVGPYSQAVQAGGFLYVSGQIPLMPQSGECPEGIEAQTQQVLKNLEAVIQEAGAQLKDVVKTTIFLTDLGQFTTVNGIYAEAFGNHRPARATVEVSALPKGVEVEIEAVVYLGGQS
ncbi:MAG: RidA family protein [Verrucomicrobiota bacterium]